jgi:hypothetical protein
VKVNIVAPDPHGDGILSRLARTLAERNGWQLGTRPNQHVDLNYSIVYIDFAQRFSDWRATPWAAYFSHLETGTPYKEFWWDLAKPLIRAKVVTAAKYGRILEGNVIQVPAPIDPMFTVLEVKRGKLPRVGFSGFVDKSGRKGEKFAARLAQDLEGIAEFVASGGGWPVQIVNTSLKELPYFYNSLDVYVCTSLIEGIPMPPLEALACGIPVVIPRDVGMLDELPDMLGIYRYDRGNYEQLLAAVLNALNERGMPDRMALAASVCEYNPNTYARAHKEGFEQVLSGKTEPQTLESDRHGKRGVYYVAYGDPARRCAEAAIKSFKSHLPDIPVALVSDSPLGVEDIFIEFADYDIGGRAAKIKIYDLAPKDWQYIAYLDADTEVVKAEELLWQIVEDGWDMVICKNPGRFAIASAMQRSDNKDECRITYQATGTEEVMQLNGGVFAFSRNHRTEKFFRCWYDEWHQWGKRDQAALLRSLWKNPLKLYVLGNEWNTITRYDDPGSTAWLLHYPMTARRWRGVLHYRLDDPQAWKAVEEFESSQR